MSEGKSDVRISDCQPCRYIGTGLFVFITAYIWYNTRDTVFSRKLPLRAVAVGSLYMALARYIYLPPFKHLAPKK